MIAGRIAASILLGLAVAALVHLVIDGSLVPERGTIVAAIAGLAGVAAALTLLLLQRGHHAAPKPDRLHRHVLAHRAAIGDRRSMPSRPPLTGRRGRSRR